MPLLALKQWIQTPLTSINPVLLYVLLLVSVYMLVLRKYKIRKPNLPPSPPRLPIVGNLYELGSMSHHRLRELTKVYGPLMLLHLGSNPTIVVSSASMAKEVLKTQDDVFASRPSSGTTKRVVYGCKDLALSPAGEYWRQVRKIFVLHLLSAKIVKSFQVVREEEVALMVENISNVSSSGPVNLSEMLTTFTNDIICRVALGRKYSHDKTAKNRLHKLIKELLELVGTFHLEDHIPTSLAWLSKLTGLERKMENIFWSWDSLLEEVIEEQLFPNNNSGQETNNFVNMLLSLENKDTIDCTTLSRDSIKAILMDMFIGGTETSATAMTWAMAELLRHPEVMKKAQEEVRSVVKQNSRVCKEDVDQMSYLKLVIKETLRMHPPLPLLITRETTRNTKIGNFDIPSKTWIIIHAWTIGRDPEVWEEPETFWPERFLQNPLKFIGQDFQFLPFGAGRRQCPGIHFSMAIVELGLANLLHHYDWELPNGNATEDLDMTETFGFALQKKSNLVVVANHCSA